MSRHAISTVAWAVVFVFGAGFYVGAWFGTVTSPAAYNAQVVERHLRVVFCDRAIKNKLINTCEVE